MKKRDGFMGGFGQRAWQDLRRLTTGSKLSTDGVVTLHTDIGFPISSILLNRNSCTPIRMRRAGPASAANPPYGPGVDEALAVRRTGSRPMTMEGGPRSPVRAWVKVKRA